MLNQLRSLAKSTAIYSVGNISSKVVGLILLPVFTNITYLSVEAYGLLGLFEAIVQLFITLFGLGIYNGIFRWFYEEKSSQGSLLFTSLATVMVMAALGVSTGFLFEKSITRLMFENPSFNSAYRWMVLTAALEMIAVIPVTLMRLKEDAKLFTISSVLRLAVILILTLWFLIKLELGLDGIFIAQTAGQAVFLLAVTPYMWNNLHFKIDWRVPTVLLSYSIPIMFSSLVGTLVQFVDRFIINSFQGLEEVGIYSLAVKLSNVIKVVVITTFSLSLTPILFKKIKDPDHGRFYSKSMTYYGFIILLIIMAVSLFSFEVIKVFTGSTVYWQAFWAIPILSLSLYFVALKSVGLMGIHISKKMWYLTLLTVIVLALNIILNIYLIPLAGSLGAASASLISQMFYFTVGYKIAQKYHFIPYEWGKIIAMPILAAFLISIGILTNSWDIWLRIPAKLTVIILFPILLYFGNFYEEIEKKRLLGFYSKWKNPSDLWNNINEFLK
jgi:O-antigen/teichoic acid export membrane protein